MQEATRKSKAGTGALARGRYAYHRHAPLKWGPGFFSIVTAISSVAYDDKWPVFYLVEAQKVIVSRAEPHADEDAASKM